LAAAPSSRSTSTNFRKLQDLELVAVVQQYEGVRAGYVDSGRGFGIADLASTPQGAEPRAGGTLAFRVLEVMESVLESAHTGAAVRISSTAERPAGVGLTVLTGDVHELQAQEAS
jgi:hypothetical protein